MFSAPPDKHHHVGPKGDWPHSFRAAGLSLALLTEAAHDICLYLSIKY